MTVSNRERVGAALDLLGVGLAPFVERELKAALGFDWQARVNEADRGAVVGKAVNLADVHVALKAMRNLWNDVFRQTLGNDERTLVMELLSARNKWAHQKPFSTDDAYRVLDSAQRLLTAVSAEEAEQLEESKQDLLRIRYEEYSRRKSRQTAQALFETPTPAGLKPWREVVEPHADVRSGGYDQAEFAADLHQVYSGQGVPEYADPAEFFRRTFLTEGLRQLLGQAVQRLSGTGGVPIVDLQTNFGGGKTHSLLALYHLFGGTPASELAGVDELLKSAGVGAAPKAHRAVLVGTKIGPGQVHAKPDGTEVHTLWGELAWQLGEAVGRGAEGYALVADADRTATNPGAALEQLFRTYSPCLVLIDEWVAYARQLYGKDGLPAGTFDTHFTFAQTLTEAAKAVPGTLVVISIPASASAGSGKSSGDTSFGDIEVGGEGGKAALDRLRNVIGRMESPWRPASSEESFEIVRRRLFEPLSAEAARQRDAVARVFREFYKKNQSDFPRGCGEGEYERRIQAAYPIHPELFDRLYNDWSALPRFQRTRGVLRLMAGVIHELWESGDASPLIMPATVPLNAQIVAFELTRYLEEAWKPIIDSDVDGPSSLPLKIDQENPNFGRLAACRRAARTVFLGSAATVKSPNKGIDMRGIKLGAVLPGESPAVFGDALRHMGERSTHLYVEAGRYWFDTHTSIIQTANDRAAALNVDDVHAELVKHVREQCKKRGEFAGVHVAPSSSADVPDEDSVRLVVLGPEYPHGAKAGDESAARAAAAELLESRGTSPRRNRNMVVFLAPDQTRLEELEAAVRQYMAWDSIDRDKDSLNLTAFFMKQTQEKRQAALEAIRQRVPETYIWLLAPEQKVGEGAGAGAPAGAAAAGDGASSGEPAAAHARGVSLGPVTWSATKVGGVGELPERVSARMVRDELLIPKYSGVLLRRELDRIPLWPESAGHIGTRQLWEYFSQYLYLPRLRDSQVLLEAIRDGVGSLAWQSDTFAYAAAYDEAEGRYVDLRHGSADFSVVLDSSSVVVKAEAAAKQLAADQAAREAFEPKDKIFTPPGEQPPLGEDGKAWESGEGGATSQPDKPAEKVTRRFFGTVELDPARLNKQIPEIAEHVVQHLVALPSAEVKVTLHIDAEVPGGVPHKTVIDVTQNTKDLKFDPHSGFEGE